MEQLFNFIPSFVENNETTTTESSTTTNDVTAYQIIRIVKSSGGFIYRNKLDTLKVAGDVEHISKRANVKAQRIGGCVVVELSEKVVSMVD